MTEIEKVILSKSGWENYEHYGLMVFDVKTPKGKDVAHIISQLSQEEIRIRYAFPNIKGKKIIISFNRKTQQLNKNKTDKAIFENADISDFLLIIEAAIKKSKGIYIDTKKIINNKEIT